MEAETIIQYYIIRLQQWRSIWSNYRKIERLNGWCTAYLKVKYI